MLLEVDTLVRCKPEHVLRLAKALGVERRADSWRGFLYRVKLAANR